MKKYLAMLVTLAVALFAGNSFAWNPPASPAPASWISDTSGVLSAEAHARLDAKLRQINQSSANEIAALILPTLDGENIADVGDRTAKTWGVGKKDLDNGVLVVLAMKEHKSRISTGKGVEGDLPDLKANDILQSARPYLRKGDVEGALGFIFDSSASTIANHKAEAAAAKTGTSSGRQASCQASGVGAGSDTGVILLVVAFSAFLGVWYLAARARRRRQEEEEVERQAREERARLRRLNAEREANRLAEERRLQRERATHTPVPVVETPVIRPVAAPAPVVHHTTHTHPVASTIAVASVALAAEEEARRHRAEEDRRRRQREQDDEDRRRRQRDEDDRRRRDSESSSSSSSSSSFDWGGGSSGGSGGFGGGDSGGGGSSSDW